MCNGESSRTSQGGLVAILHPLYDSPKTSHKAIPSQKWHLFFNDIQSGQTDSTMVQFSQGLDLMTASRASRVDIHHDGDLSRSSSPTTSVAETPLYSFSVRPEDLWKTTGGAEMGISPRLPLEVGGDGIVGRRVAVVSETQSGETRIAEGIIGWN
ncbi:uncharacterized protein BDZ99DRAFT_472070 [Mytilinidion resinicola]|uniref:Uncharacterized protein n=1 Tax=Mytilinidion resinicola TaxID=574789 RepID=A0A6A6Z0I1_9PEZI|nr:uncharacterized protein BDZ99DRAFT_472070 [Mytilinidion resinicola]KAF2814672.1 hypothetical protein BDZ99DRAFT_472070 [Mytilinidion resinicola]